MRVPDDDAAALGQPPTRGAQSGLHLAHVHAVLQTDDLDVLVANVLHLFTVSQIDHTGVELATFELTALARSMLMLEALPP